ncbi:MAG: hypothetical protein OHK0013_46150 [Sandaracinaceae bacterium]
MRVGLPLRATMLALGMATGASTSACSGREREAPEQERPSPHVPPRDEHDVRVADPALPPAAVGHIEGNVLLGTVTAVEGTAVERGTPLRLQGEGRAVLELPAGARATLYTPGEVALAEPPDEGLWVRRGAVHVADPPSGLGGRSPLRVSTPAVTLELQGAADVLVVVGPGGVTHAFVLTGRVEASASEVDARHRLRVVDVVAGMRVRVADRLEEPVQGVPRLDEAIAEARRLVRGEAPSATTPVPPAPPAPATAVPSAGVAMARLDEAMRWLELEQRRGRDLTARHRAAVQAGRSDEAMEYQREIVGHAQSVHALRQVVLARWGRLALADGSDPAEVRGRLERLRNLLGS